MRMIFVVDHENGFLCFIMRIDFVFDYENELCIWSREWTLYLIMRMDLYCIWSWEWTLYLIMRMNFLF